MNEAIVKKLQAVDEHLAVFQSAEEGVPKLSDVEIELIHQLRELGQIMRELAEVEAPPIQLELLPPAGEVEEEPPQDELRFTQLAGSENELYALADGCVWRREFFGTEWLWVRVPMKKKNLTKLK